MQVLQTAQRVGVLDAQVLRWSLQALLCGRVRRMAALRRTVRRLVPARQPLAAARAARRRRTAPERPLAAAAAAGDDEQRTTSDELRPRQAASRQEVLTLGRLPHADRTRARAGHRSADAALRAAAEAHPTAPRGARAARPAAGPAGHDPAQRGQRRHAVPPGLEGPAPRAPAAGAADRRQPLDGAVQLLLPAPGARARRRADRRAQLHLPHPRHRGVAGAARPRPLARAGAAAPDRAGLGRRHAHRREPGAVQPRACAARRAFAHRRHRDERRLRHRRARACCPTRWRSCAAARGASSGSIRCATGPATRRSARACRRRCRTWTCWRRGPTWQHRGRAAGSSRRCGCSVGLDHHKDTDMGCILKGNSGLYAA